MYVTLDERDMMDSSHCLLTGIGQMVGDTTNGIWNEPEGISLTIKVSVLILFVRSSCLTKGSEHAVCRHNPHPPRARRTSLVVPFDCAAKTIVELVNLGWYFCNAFVIACISASIVDL